LLQSPAIAPLLPLLLLATAACGLVQHESHLGHPRPSGGASLLTLDVFDAGVEALAYREVADDVGILRGPRQSHHCSRIARSDEAADVCHRALGAE